MPDVGKKLLTNGLDVEFDLRDSAILLLFLSTVASCVAKVTGHFTESQCVAGTIILNRIGK